MSIPHPLGGGRRQRHHRHVREMLPQFFQLAIFGAEIVAPFADAMGFVDRDLGDVPIERASRETYPASAALAPRKAAGIDRGAVLAIGRALRRHPAPNSGRSLQCRWPAARRPGLSSAR